MERLRQGSPSPSPRKRPLSGSLKGRHLPSDGEDDDEEDEEDDEETLQLKLQAIEARLKLKKLQSGKRKGTSRSSTALGGSIDHSKALEPSALLQPGLQVPVSPIKDRRPPPEPKSPARVLLGIDKGLKARDVSLKRPASSSASTLGGSIRSNFHRGTGEPEVPTAKPKSFSERIAEGRLSAQEQKEKEERIQQSRSRGFGLGAANDVFASSRATSQHTETSRSSTSEEMVPPSSRSHLQRPRPDSGALSSRAPSAALTQPIPSRLSSSTPSSREALSRRKAQERISAFPKDKTPTSEGEQDSNSASSTFEPFSSLHMTKRLIDHTKLTRTLHGKQIYTIPQLLKEVKSPHYDPPDCETDYIVLGIIASKSTPKDHKNNPKSINTAGNDDYSRPKFMAIRMTDLKWEVDLFLFDTGFEQWWKMTEGTVIAILNPGIMPPRNKDSGAFSLKVTSSEDTILEIGTSRDLGFCKSIKADGHQCTQWIDKRKTEVCEYHISIQIEKARKGRMEVNTMVGLPGKKGSSGGGKKGNFGRDDELKSEGRYHDRQLHETMYIVPKEFRTNTASMLDEEDQARLRGMEKKDAIRKRKREREKEDALARTLGSKGNGAGSEYLKYHRDVERTTTLHDDGTSTSHMLPTKSNSTQMASEPVDAEALGLLSNRASLVSLSPVKGRKRGIPSSSSTGNSMPLGWGGAFKRGLMDKSPRKSSLKQDDAEPSPRKRARLLLDGKGIREPGRESLGGSGPGDIFLDGVDEDDDELEIVKG
jgi:minichromosome maintenance protein 10